MVVISMALGDTPGEESVVKVKVILQKDMVNTEKMKTKKLSTKKVELVTAVIPSLFQILVSASP